jgi:hypothetical protein
MARTLLFVVGGAIMFVASIAEDCISRCVRIACRPTY